MKDKSLVLIIFVILFLSSTIFNNAYYSSFVFVFIFAIIFFKNKNSLRMSGGWRFWFFPSLFLFMLPFISKNFNSENVYDFKKTVFLWFHLYLFNCIVNFFTDIFSINEIIHYFENIGKKNWGLRIVIALSAFRKLKYDFSEIFYFYYCENKGVWFFRNLNILIYSLIRSSVKIAKDISELLFIRSVF